MRRGRGERIFAYPFSAIVTGLAFFIMGGNYGGRYYAISLAFFALAMLLPLFLEWAAPAYGLVWAACAWQLSPDNWAGDALGARGGAVVEKKVGARFYESDP